MSARLAETRTVLSGLYQSGASKILLPRTSESALTAVLLNTAGGVTGGDRFTLSARAEAGSHLTLTTQAAERIYRAQPGEVGKVTTQLVAEPGASLHWLPQETILFDNCALRRRLQAELAPDASLLLVEPVVFGRMAMGEAVTHGLFRDRIEIRRDGQLVFADATRMEGAISEQLDLPAVAAGHRAMASLVYVGADAERHLDPLRQILPECGGASLIRPGVLFARLLAPDSYLLRRSLIPMIDAIRRAPLPKTWTL
ncbi:urease accessory protein UreD [Pseudooceanicola lipolyticus]|uniref:urease accessory protein UreD n=1 Tax=Pseudooceanicola lipolyticus TaxID=2029104 RepID=UPI001F0CB31B|nr:urease accessory protein UreD [Pseudooceanicola lipolyticus]